MPMIDLLAAPAYHTARAIMGAAARLYFRRIEVRRQDRIPGHGPLLVVANHPASFADVVILGASMSRRLHFLAMAPIFKPWIRGLALRLCGTLPVYRRQDDPALMARNDDTFLACHEILDAGGAVLIFPEGTSLTDRSIVRVKTGAARLALGQAARPQRAGPLVLLPVGLHFADRTGFQSEVVVSVGRPIDIGSFRDMASRDNSGAVRALTDHIQAVLEKLILNVPETDRAAMVSAVERLYGEEARDGDENLSGLDVAREMAECIEHFSLTDPARVARAWERIRRYERNLERLRIRDRTLREMLPSRGRVRERLRLLALGCLGIGPALVGAVVHYAPYRLCGAAVHPASDPTRVAALRMASGALLFPLTYAAIGFGLSRGLGWPPVRIAVALALLALLGWHALAYFRWLSHQRQRIRLVLLRASNRRLVARLRRERRELIGICDRSRREFEAARGRVLSNP